MPLKQNSDISYLRGPVPLSHFILRQLVQPGDYAIDATCGNGNDTLLLAELVGKNGRVWAFDIQREAISQTSARLQAVGMNNHVRLINTGHETMQVHIDRQVKAVVFNLGYLPGGDRTLITRPETTLTALEQSLPLLLPGGIVAISVYPGHSGGDDERQTVESWAGGLAAKVFYVWRMGQINVTSDAPYLLLIQKAAR